ncbi:MAG: hypothetical protein HFK00_00500 [Oscillospiraceae bacterium]|nr:hypothetical protein [Oscillospiraceae bacterium]
MKSKLTNKQKQMAYVLNKDDDFGFSMEKIGILFGTSQSTISNAIKEINHQKEVNNLKQELADIKKYLIEEQKIKPKSIFIDVDVIDDDNVDT